jgi:ankyrin repeat protein
MGHVHVVQFLLDYKASIDLQDSDGCTALHKAAAQVRNIAFLIFDFFFAINPEYSILTLV